MNTQTIDTHKLVLGEKYETYRYGQLVCEWQVKYWEGKYHARKNGCTLETFEFPEDAYLEITTSMAEERAAWPDKSKFKVLAIPCWNGPKACPCPYCNGGEECDGDCSSNEAYLEFRAAEVAND